MENKKPWQSKTLVLNALLGLISCVALFVPGAKAVSDFINANGAMIGAIWAFANIVLRSISKDKIVLVD